MHACLGVMTKLNTFCHIKSFALLRFEISDLLPICLTFYKT